MVMRFKSYEEYKNTLEMVMRQDERLSEYAVKLVLEVMEYTRKLSELEDVGQKVENNPVVGVDISSVL